MAQRILMLLIVYVIMLACDYKKLSHSFSWREQGIYLLLNIVVLYQGINYLGQMKLPFVYEAFEYVFAIPAKHIAAWLQLTGS